MRMSESCIAVFQAWLLLLPNKEARVLGLVDAKPALYSGLQRTYKSILGMFNT